MGAKHPRHEKFYRAFSKARAGGGRVALLAARTRRNLLFGISFLIAEKRLRFFAELARHVFICAFSVKEKSGWGDLLLKNTKRI